MLRASSSELHLLRVFPRAASTIAPSKLHRVHALLVVVVELLTELCSLANMSGPQRSQEGWVVFVTGVHEEAQEDDVRDAFSEYGQVKTVKLNADRKTGLCKGYALVQYSEFTDAQDAINELHGSDLLGRTLGVDWAFVKPAGGGRRSGGR